MTQQLIFTEHQNQAFEQFLVFLRAKENRKVWVLTGFAGTGKSTLIAHIVKQMQQEKLSFKLLAPTGRAAKVLSNYADFPASTIHRHIYFLVANGVRKGLPWQKTYTRTPCFCR